MSDAAEDFEFTARQLLNKGKTHPLREQMRAFVSEHDSTVSLKQLRDELSEGKNVSEIVHEEREERV